MMVETTNTIERSLAFAATIIILDKPRVPPLVNLVKQKVMYHSVSKMRRKYFPLHWFIDNKSCRRPRRIGVSVNLPRQRSQFSLGNCIKFHHLRCFRFAAPSCSVGFFQLFGEPGCTLFFCIHRLSNDTPVDSAGSGVVTPARHASLCGLPEIS